MGGEGEGADGRRELTTKREEAVMRGSLLADPHLEILMSASMNRMAV